LLDPAFFARFQVEGVPLDFFDDVFGLDLPLEPSESVFKSFALL
jgi:hypothetical protein